MKLHSGQFFSSIAMVALLAGALFLASGAAAEELVPADRVVVHKAERKLYLYHGSQLIGSYKVALGLNPQGPKQREKDYRTPEGRYFLSRRNTRSDFFLAIQVSYPNKQDERYAHRHGWAPGGAIMIHGLPNVPKHTPLYYAETDWTDGCIAVTNDEMDEIWALTQDNTPIDIFH